LNFGVGEVGGGGVEDDEEEDDDGFFDIFSKKYSGRFIYFWQESI
jgi:hypothetical protein